MSRSRGRTKLGGASGTFKIKVTGILSRDKRIEFLGRVVEKIEYGLMLGLPEGYFKAVYEAYGIKKPSQTPPDLRKMLDDAIGKPELQAALTSEAASKYRSAIGKISWGGQTRLDLTYFISVLSRGQSTPLVVHENCLRSFLRYLMSVDHLKQVMCAEECCGRVEAYVDSNWAPERNNDRKSLSGCVILVDGYPVKGFTRQQTSVALSSAEAELIALTEGAKEAVGLVSLVQHVYGSARTCQDPPAIYSDSPAAINIGSMHGLLRRVRHVDLRVCWVQSAIQDRLISLSWVPGTQNPADLFTKALTRPEVHLERLGIVEHLPRQSMALDFDHDLFELCRMLGKVVDELGLERLSWQLDEVDVKKTRWVVVEFCTSRNSGLKVASEAFADVEVICVTEDENGLLDETIALLRAGIVRFVENCVHVLVWSSTPCTGGCLCQHLNKGKPGYETRLRRLWGIRRKLWKNLAVLVKPLEDVGEDLQPYLAVEWPKTCQYWSWKDVQKLLWGRPRKMVSTIVDGCMVGLRGDDNLLIHKRWRVDTDVPTLSAGLSHYRCSQDHEHSARFNLRETQHYPAALCTTVLLSL